MVQREGVYLVEFPFLFDTEQHLDDFGVSMPAKEFYDRMRKGNFPTTSQISIPAYTEVFERAAQSGIPTVYLSFSSALSGSYNVSLLVRDQLQEKYPEMQLHIVDTKLLRKGLWYMKPCASAMRALRLKNSSNGLKRRAISLT